MQADAVLAWLAEKSGEVHWSQTQFHECRAAAIPGQSRECRFTWPSRECKSVSIRIVVISACRSCPGRRPGHGCRLVITLVVVAIHECRFIIVRGIPLPWLQAIGHECRFIIAFLMSFGHRSGAQECLRKVSGQRTSAPTHVSMGEGRLLLRRVWRVQVWPAGVCRCLILLVCAGELSFA